MRTLLIASLLLIVGCTTTDPEVVNILTQRIQRLENESKIVQTSMVLKEKIPPVNFVQMMSVNVSNTNLTDEAFRELIRNTIPIVDIPVTDKSKR